jgi:predicted nucleic acid-binding protein
MAAYFFDSSALVKRYVNETGSGWVQTITDAAMGHEVYIARITTVEVIAAFVRRARSGSIDALTAAAATAQFKTDAAADYRIIELTGELAGHAIAATERHGLRGYDAVQLATALEINDRLRAQLLALGLPINTYPCFIVTSDIDLNIAAVAEGLAVEDPNAHP